MESKAKILGHPAHQQMIVFPLGLLATAVIFDLISWATQDSKWTYVSYYLIGAGVLGGLAAAVFGFIDWKAIPRQTRANRVGLVHAVGNVIVLLLFGASFVLRGDSPLNPPPAALVSSYCGGVLALFTGWLGGELVARLGGGVDDNAGLNAPSSLAKPSSAHATHHPKPL